MSGISVSEFTSLTEASNLSSSASFNMPAAGAAVGSETLLPKSEVSAYFGKCSQDFLWVLVLEWHQLMLT